MICFVSELIPQNFVLQYNNDQKSLKSHYECLKNKWSELWPSIIGRDHIRAFLYKNSSDHGGSVLLKVGLCFFVIPAEQNHTLRVRIDAKFFFANFCEKVYVKSKVHGWW